MVNTETHRSKHRMQVSTSALLQAGHLYQSQGTLWKTGRKIVSQRSHRTGCLQNQQGSCMNYSSCVCLQVDQAGRHSSMKQGGVLKTPPLAEELLEVNGCWGPSQFPLGVWFLADHAVVHGLKPMYMWAALIRPGGLRQRNEPFYTGSWSWGKHG